MWYIDRDSVFDYEIFIDGKVSIRVCDSIDDAAADISALFSYPVFKDIWFESDVYLLIKDVRENRPSLIPDAYNLLQRVILLWYKYQRAVHKKEIAIDSDKYLYNDKHRQELMQVGKKVVDYYQKANDQKVDADKYSDNDISATLYEAFTFGQKAFDVTVEEPNFALSVMNLN